MQNPTTEERNLKTFIFMIVVSLVITILMRGINSRMLIPHILYIGIAIICALVGIISYGGFIYIKMFKSKGSNVVTDMAVIIALGVVVYFTASFTIGVLANS